MLITAASARAEKEFLEAIGAEDRHAKVWPLPNMKAASENEFWGWRSTYTFSAEAWLGHAKHNGDWCVAIAFYVGHSQFIDGGFLVLHYYEYKKERTEYYTWKACDHDFKGENIGNCLNRYTCTKCHKSYEVDSSG